MFDYVASELVGRTLTLKVRGVDSSVFEQKVSR